MRIPILRNCSKGLALNIVAHKQIARFSRLIKRSMSNGQFTNLPLAVNLTSSKRNFADARNIDRSIRLQGQALNFEYLNYKYVITSKDRWIEFEEGCTFDVGIFDSYSNKEYDSRVPVIVGIPGCIETHENLVLYLSMFVLLGYRVIIPNLPGTKYCNGRSKAEEHIFTMTANEKAQFIKDTLETIKVPNVDMLVTHSDSAHAALELSGGCLFKLNNVRSIALIEPLGLQYTKAMNPLWFYRRISRIIETNKHLAPLIRLVLNTWKIFTDKRKWTANDIMLFSRNVGALNLEESDLNAQRFLHSPLPTRVFYSDVGSAINIQSTEKLLEVMGISKSTTTICDEKCNIISKGTIGNNQQSFYFKDGEITEEKLTFIRTELVKFLKTIRPDITEF